MTPIVTDESAQSPDCPHLSVIIVNFGSCSLVAPLVRSLPQWATVIVVDNYTSDYEIASVNRECAAATIVSLPSNNGFGSAVNAGLLRARADDWILLLNPDAHLTPTDLETLWATARASGLDVSSPLILAPDTGRIWYGGGRIHLRSAVVTHDDIGALPQRRVGWAPTQFVSGCIMLLSPTAVEQILPFNEDLFMYWEDVELSLDASSRRLRLAVTYDAVGFHAQGGTLREGRGWSRLHYRYTARNRLIVAARCPELSTTGALAWTPWLTIRTIFRITLNEERRTAKILALMKGTSEGVISAASILLTPRVTPKHTRRRAVRRHDRSVDHDRHRTP